MTLLPTVHGFELGHRYGSRSARDHFKDVLDTASFGAAAVISRKDVPPVAAVNATELAELLAEVSPISVLPMPSWMH
jgi:hypothetical protein